jgi:lipopolysaccharide/colanic/teichoic acid biosynthesis glycosyltransferase
MMEVQLLKLHSKSQIHKIMYRVFKRFFDIIFSLVAILLFFPLLIPIIIILKFSGEGEIFYYQKRIGIKNKKFNILKFATMIKNSPNIGDGIYTAKGDSRILPFGHFLRKYKINEIPQIFNIFFGNMSIVGPRPLIYETFIFYSKEVKSVLSNMKPGLSGIGSIVFRDEELILEKAKKKKENFYRDKISPYKGALEVWYSQNISFYTDFMIIFLTVWVVFFPKSNLVYKVFKTLPSKPDYMQ